MDAIYNRKFIEQKPLSNWMHLLLTLIKIKIFYHIVTFRLSALEYCAVGLLSWKINTRSLAIFSSILFYGLTCRRSRQERKVVYLIKFETFEINCDACLLIVCFYITFIIIIIIITFILLATRITPYNTIYMYFDRGFQNSTMLIQKTTYKYTKLLC